MVVTAVVGTGRNGPEDARSTLIERVTALSRDSTWTLTASVPIIDVTGPEPVEHRGYVPPRSVVVPGTRPREFPAGTYQLACALIIGTRRESTDLRTGLNEALREFGIGS